MVLKIEVPDRVYKMLEECVAIGIWGDSPQEVALSFLRNRLEELAATELLSRHKANKQTP